MMQYFYEILLISTSVIGFYVSFVLLVIAKQNRLLNRLLAFYTLTSSIYFLLIYSMIRGWGEIHVVMVRTFTPTSLINSAIGYLYFRALLNDEFRLSKRDLIHALPFALNLAYYSPLAIDLLSGSFQLNEVVSAINLQTYLLPFGPITEKFSILFRMCISAFYLTLAVNLFLNKKSIELKSQLKNIYPNTVRWMGICIAGYILFGTSVIANQSRVLFSDQPYSLSYGGLNAIFILIGWNIMIVYVLMNPEILFGLPQFTHSVSVNTTASSHQPGAPDDTGFSTVNAQGLGITPSDNARNTKDVFANELRPKRRAVSAEASTIPVSEEGKDLEISEAIKLLVERIHDYVDHHQPYRNQDFTIASLSEALGAPSHHIAFIFKQVLRQSFVEYRNGLRVDHAKKLIRMGKHKQITIEAIGTDAGFSSRATFFAVFKNVTGKTPGQYAADYKVDAQA